MSEKRIPDGGPAFPWPGGEVPISEGMSLRDWFAGLAMHGILANPNLSDTADDELAEDAYEVADAMLAKRDEPDSPIKVKDGKPP